MDHNSKRIENKEILTKLWTHERHKKQAKYIEIRHPVLTRYGEDIAQDACLKFLDSYNPVKNLNPLISYYRYTLQCIAPYYKLLLHNKEVSTEPENMSFENYSEICDNKSYLERIIDRKPKLTKLLDTLYLYRKTRGMGKDDFRVGSLNEPAKAYWRKVLLFSNLLDMQKKFEYNIPKHPVVHTSVHVKGETNLSFKKQKNYTPLANRKFLFQIEPRLKMAEAVHYAQLQRYQMPSLFKQYKLENEENPKLAKQEKIPIMGGVVTDKDNNIIGKAHKGFKGNPLTDHCEFILFERILTREERKKVEGGKLYVTLEPCNARGIGKIPCAARCVLMKLKTVYIGNLDLNKSVTNEGVKILRTGIIKFEKNQTAIIESFKQQVLEQFNYPIEEIIKNDDDYIFFKIGEPLEVKNFDLDLNMQLLYINGTFQGDQAPQHFE